MARAVYFKADDWLAHVWAQCTDNPSVSKMKGYVLLQSVRATSANRIVPKLTATLVTPATVVQFVKLFTLKVYSHENTTELAFDRAQREARLCRAMLRRFGIEPAIELWNNSGDAVGRN